MKSPLVLPTLTASTALFLAGCSALAVVPPTLVHQPTTARPESVVKTAPVSGSIYQVNQSRPLFEDQRARHVGDTITINLVENTNAEKGADTSASRSSSLSATIAALPRMFPFNLIGGLDTDTSSDASFSGAGASSANNVFNGTITVTVIEVMSNGNLLVSGEKLLSINQGNEHIRFSGVINPTVVTTSNTVQSTQVADARMEYKGSGAIEDHNHVGWLQRFFTAFSPI